MNINDIIVEPFITEKSIKLFENNVYTFKVAPTATKTDIKIAIETIFSESNAKVSKIRIIKVKRKKKKLGKHSGFKAGFKKALVTLSDGSIPIYGADGIDSKKDDNKKKGLQIIDTEKIMKQSEKQVKDAK